MSILTLVIVGFLVIAIASVIALGYAITHAEEGYEDSTGYHAKEQSSPAANTTAATVDTGNPWDQVEGASCPIDLGQSLRPLRPH